MMRKYLAAVWAVGACFGAWTPAIAGPIGANAFNDPTVITFEDVALGQVTTEYLNLGVEFLTQSDGVPGAGTAYGTHVTDGTNFLAIHSSGSNFVFGGTQVIEFTTPVIRAGAFVSQRNGTQYLSAYNPLGVLLGTVTIPTAVTTSYMFAGWEAPAIKWLVIGDDNLAAGAPWTNGGSTTFIDDVTFEHAPEPGSSLLLLSALSAGALRRLRFRRVVRRNDAI